MLSLHNKWQNIVIEKHVSHSILHIHNSVQWEKIPAKIWNEGPKLQIITYC